MTESVLDMFVAAVQFTDGCRPNVATKIYIENRFCHLLRTVVNLGLVFQGKGINCKCMEIHLKKLNSMA